MPLIWFSGIEGIFIFRAVPTLKPFSMTNLIILRANLAAKPKSGLSLVFKEMATEGKPRNAPSVAAEAVPEYKRFIPTLDPMLIPERIISGGCCNISWTASLTQSAGVPFTP